MQQQQSKNVSSLQESSMLQASSYETSIQDIYGSHQMVSKNFPKPNEKQQQPNIVSQKEIQGQQESELNANKKNQNKVDSPQIMQKGQAKIVKTQTFDFKKLRRHRRRHNRTITGNNQFNLYKKDQKPTQSPNRASSVQTKQRVNIPDLFNQNCGKFEEYLKSTSNKDEEEILSRSVQNSALTSSRLQKQEFNSKLKKTHQIAVESLQDLADHKQNNPFASGPVYPLIQDQKEDEEVSLKAFQIARRQSLLKAKGLLQRRDSLFGSSNMITSDPLQKLLQTKKYLETSQIPPIQTERSFSRRDSIINQRNTTSGTLKNEFFQKSLNTTLAQITEKPVKENQIVMRNKTPNPSSLTLDNTVQQFNFKDGQLSYRERVYKKHLEQSHQLNTTSFINQPQNILSLPNMNKSPSSRINDAVQQALVLDHINDFNQDSNKYNSLLIHLGVLLKKTISSSEQGHNLPCFFLTTVCCQILDKISIFFPQFNKIMVPLKNTLFQGIFYQYEVKKHIREDEQEIEKTKEDIDLTKKDPKIKIKYLRYETYHDKYNQMVKENKALKREIAKMKRDFHHDRKAGQIIKNLTKKFQKNRQKEHLKQVFLAIKHHHSQKYQELFSNVIGNAVLGPDIRGKMLMRKFFAEWQLFAMESKFRKAKKEIEYYQNKIDDMDDSNSSQRVQIKELITENIKLKHSLNECSTKLAAHENEAAQQKISELRKKPIQVKYCLKIYFKYIFTNPLISRLRIRRPLALFALSHQRFDEELKDQSKKPKKLIDMSLLLKKRETIEEGGPGVQVFLNMTLRDIMVRWVNFMIEKTIFKLNPIIEILEKELHGKRMAKKKQTNKDQQDDDMTESESEEDSDQITDSGLYLALPDSKPTIFNNYQPFKNYQKDLRLLLTFKQMISKLVNDFQLNMVHDGVFQALLFAIDQSERTIEISASALQPRQTQGSQQKSYHYNEDIVDEITVPDYQNILLYVNDTSLQSRAKLIIEQIEKIQGLKFDWYCSISELLIGKEQTYTTVLLYLFYNYSNLESFQPREQQYKYIKPMISEDLLQEENKSNLQIFKKILYLSRQKLLPVLMRRVHSHLQDVSLLYSQDELHQEGSSALSQLLELPFMRPKDLMKRWVNHLLRSYHEIKLQHELESRFRAKFASSNNDINNNRQRDSSPNRIDNGVSQSNSPNRITQNVRSTQKVQQNEDHLAMRRLSSITIPNANKKQMDVPQFGQEERKDSKNGSYRIGKDSKAQVIIRELNLDPSKPNLGFEIAKMSELKQNNFHRLILILAFLSPETIWDMHDLDYHELRRTPDFIEVVETFLAKSTPNQKHLLIMNAIARVSKKNNLISMNDLYTSEKIEFTDLLIELFLARPCLSNSRHQSTFIQSLQHIEDFYNSQRKYLNDFDKEKYDKIDQHIKKLKEEKEDITQAFAFIQDCDRVFYSIKEKLLINKLNFPNPNHVIAKQMKIHERSELLLSDIEKQIINLNKSYLFQLLTFRQMQQGNQWASALEEVIRKYLYPFRRYLNVYMDVDGFISYFDMWRAIKGLNIRSFNLDCREVEQVLIKILKLKDNAKANTLSKKSMPAAKEDEQLMSIFEDQEPDETLFMKKIKSEIQYKVFSSKRVGSNQRFRTKSSIVKEIEESLENAQIKTQLYRAKFQASDLIIVLITILFRQSPADFVRELSVICPSLQDEGAKNVNKMLSKEKQQVHIEAYLTEFQPSSLFEQFLIHCVFIKSDFAKKHPFRFNMMKDDFRQFLDHYLNSLFAVFDFYLHEYATQYPQNLKFKHFSIQVEAVYGLLRDFNAFNPESGLTKNNFRKILANIQRQILNEQKQQSSTSMQIKTDNLAIGSLTPSKGGHSNRNASPYSNKTAQAQAMLSSQDNQLSMITDGFDSLIFFEFMELLYLVSQYYSPDPFVNPNQKFADFLERVVFVNIQFKIKSKKILDSPHKNNLIRSLENQKVIRGASLETFNSYFDLH